MEVAFGEDWVGERCIFGNERDDVCCEEAQPSDAREIVVDCCAVLQSV